MILRQELPRNIALPLLRLVMLQYLIYFTKIYRLALELKVETDIDVCKPLKQIPEMGAALSDAEV